jgi:ATP-dependent RNA helicase RhlE
VHRIGRTGRAGATGEAISLVSPDDLEYLAAIEKLIKRKVERVLVPGYEPDPATLTALLGSEAAAAVRHAPTAIAPAEPGRPRERSERAGSDRGGRERGGRERSGRERSERSESHGREERPRSHPARAPSPPADPIFSKPYEPGTGATSENAPSDASKHAAPAGRRVRPIGALLGGLGRKS